MIRGYDPAADRASLWDLKVAFERELGTATGGEGKAETYEAKLTDEYRDRWLDWAERCVEEEPCIRVRESEDGLDGYVFLLPESMTFIWDAAVVNEVYVRPEQRGTDVADALMTDALAHAREQDLPLDRVVLDVDRLNDRARAFYEKHGFSHWGELVAREL